jgi:hypothetical protein
MPASFHFTVAPICARDIGDLDQCGCDPSGVERMANTARWDTVGVPPAFAEFQLTNFKGTCILPQFAGMILIGTFADV